MGSKRFSRTTFKLLSVFAVLAVLLAGGITITNPGQAFALQCPDVVGLDPTTPAVKPTLNGSTCSFSNISAKDPSSPDCGSNYSRVLQTFDCQTAAIPDGASTTPPTGATTCKGTGDHYDATLKQCVHNPTAVDPATNVPKCDPPYTLVQNTLCATAPTNSSYNGSDNNQADPDEPDPCPVSSNQALRWLACPVFEMMSGATNALDAFIDQYMAVGNDIYESGNEAQYKAAWSTFRNFGIALVLVAGLIMLVSEVLGLSIVDAYTVRKVLPRLLVAIIGITVSWELCKFIIGFFDDLGQAVGSIIYTSFGQPGHINIIALLTVSWFGGGAAIGAAWLLLGPLGLLSLLGTLVLAMLVGAAVLVLRQAVIIAAVLLAPLAIAAYILPNTSKFANFWWETFTRMLMLYPIATGLIALCKSLGNITMGMSTKQTAPLQQLISTLVGLLFFFAGYALLPVAFRLAGGLVATIGGLANDRSRGAFDRLKGFRGNQTAANTAALANGSRFKGNNRLAGRLNNFSEGAAAFSKSRYKGAFLTNKAARDTAIGQQRSLNAMAHAKSDAGQAAQFNDDLLRAQAVGATESEARQNLATIFGMNETQINTAISMAQANGGFSAARQISAAKQLAATGTGYDDLNQMARTIGVAARGNTGAIEDMVGSVRGDSKKAGRYDLGAPGHGTISKLANASMASNGAAGPPPEALENAYIESALSTDNVSLLRGKPKSIANQTSAITNRMVRNQAIIDDNTPGNEAKQQQARLENAELNTKLSNIKLSTSYAPEVASSTFASGRTSYVLEPPSKDEGPRKFNGVENGAVKGAIQQIEVIQQPKVVRVDQTTGQEVRQTVMNQVENKPMVDRDGNIRTKPVLDANPQYREDVADVASRITAARNFDPNRNSPDNPFNPN